MGYISKLLLSGLGIGKRSFIVFAGILVLHLGFAKHMCGQPYFDVGGVTVWHMPYNSSSFSYNENYAIAFLSLPVQINNHNTILVSPFFEHREINPDKYFKDYSFNGVAIPITWLHYFRDSVWSFTITALPRSNGSGAEINNTALQYGGALITTIKLKDDFKLKFGLYYNREYFGDFFIPLAGMEWKVNPRLNIFGVLPGSMKIEYQLGKNVYGGGVFKSITNSYRFQNTDGYLKVSDNHIGLFADFYLPHHITLIAETGYTVLKSIKNRSDNNLENFKGDGLMLKAGVAYRIRLKQ